MRVLLLANHYRAGPGGAETMLLLTERLLREQGHRTVPFAVREPGSEPTPWARYFPPSATGPARAWSPRAWRDLARLLDAVEIDLAHVHHVFEGLTMSVVDALRARGVPVVMTLHDYKPVCPNYRLFTGGGPCERCLDDRRWWNVVRHRCLEGPAWRGAVAAAEAYLTRGSFAAVDLFLAPSRFLRDRVVAGGLPSERVAVLPNPVPLAQPRRAPAWPPRFIYAGRLTAEKGLDDLLDAARRLPAGRVVDIYGQGPLGACLRRRAVAERLPVSFFGFASQQAVARALETATAAVLPARWYENCPMAVLEAAALGVTTVATRTGGLPELIDDGHTGLLVPPGDPDALATALTSLASDPSRAVALGRRARQRARARHHPDAHVGALLGHYRRVMAGRASRPSRALAPGRGRPTRRPA